MRVIAGSARGRVLRAPATTTTRPTSDLIRGVIFSMLDAEAQKRGFTMDEDGRFASGLAWPRVLDLYAGSGALGIEALSRGAQYALFADVNRESTQCITTNLHNTDLDDRADVLQRTVSAVLARPDEPFDLVLLDPPYDDFGAAGTTLDSVISHARLNQGGVIVEERASKAPAVTVVPPALTILRTRDHGHTRVTLYVLSD